MGVVSNCGKLKSSLVSFIVHFFNMLFNFEVFLSFVDIYSGFLHLVFVFLNNVHLSVYF